MWIATIDDLRCDFEDYEDEFIVCIGCDTLGYKHPKWVRRNNHARFQDKYSTGCGIREES